MSFLVRQRAKPGDRATLRLGRRRPPQPHSTQSAAERVLHLTASLWSLTWPSRYGSSATGLDERVRLSGEW